MEGSNRMHVAGADGAGCDMEPGAGGSGLGPLRMAVMDANAGVCVSTAGSGPGVAGSGTRGPYSHCSHMGPSKGNH